MIMIAQLAHVTCQHNYNIEPIYKLNNLCAQVENLKSCVLE